MIRRTHELQQVAKGYLPLYKSPRLLGIGRPLVYFVQNIVAGTGFASQLYKWRSGAKSGAVMGIKNEGELHSKVDGDAQEAE
jgi:hypothetical protein